MITSHHFLTKDVIKLRFMNEICSTELEDYIDLVSFDWFTIFKTTLRKLI